MREFLPPPATMDSEASVRVSDADCDRVVEALAEHHVAGRLSFSELNDRVEAAFRALTGADLTRLLNDLPAPSQRRPSVVRRTPCASSGDSWSAWTLTALICMVIWIATSVGDGQVSYFWPVWVIVPWGLTMMGSRLSRADRRMGTPDRADGGTPDRADGHPDPADRQGEVRGK